MYREICNSEYFLDIISILRRDNIDERGEDDPNIFRSF